MSFNEATLIGNLGKDPETRNTQNGSKVVSFPIATSEQWKDKSTGEKREKTEWHNIVIWNEHLADIAEKYLRKGSKVFLRGAIQTRKWTGNDGVDKYTTEVVLQKYRGEIVMLGDKGDKQEALQDEPGDDLAF